MQLAVPLQLVTLLLLIGLSFFHMELAELAAINTTIRSAISEFKIIIEGLRERP